MKSIGLVSSRILGGCFLLVWLGCGAADYPTSKSYDGGEKQAVPSSGSVADQANSVATSTPLELAEGETASTEGGQKPAVANRKIIYDTTLDLVVEDYQRFESQLPTLVTRHGGFISNSDTDRRYNNQQSGTWVVRIPVDAYTVFLSGLDSLGFAESRQENAQDVTEEYVDVEARIRNKRSLEQRILTLLDERSGKLSDVLEIERELARVREEIERMEGRLRFLKDRTQLATVTINCREQRVYQPSAAPTLVSRLGHAWGDSVAALRKFGENLAVILIAAVPWLVVLGLPMWMVWKIFRRVYRRYQ